MQPRRLMLTADEFGTLVQGGEVERNGVIVALADIGFDHMDSAIRRVTDVALERSIVNTQNDALRLFLQVVIETGGGFPQEDPAVQAVGEKAYREGLVTAPIDSVERFVCPECEAPVSVDEDGCCVTCGADAPAVRTQRPKVTEKGRAWMNLPRPT